MSQFARPDADITDGAWLNEAASATDMYQSIDEDVSSPNDSDYVESEAGPSSSPVVFNLSAITDPVSSSGHVMRWRRSKSGGGATLNLTVELRQGYVNEGSPGTLIKTVSDSDIPNGFATTTATLSAGEADAITDYSDLQVRIVATQV